MKVKYLLEGCGIAILVLLSYIWPQVSPNHVAIYFSVLPVTSVTSGILIDVVALAAISTLVITLASRGDGDTNGRYVWVALMFVAISAAVSSIAKLAEVHRLTPNSAVLAGGMVLPVCLTRYWSPLKYKVLVRGFRLALALIGLCAIWIIPQLLFIALHRQSSDQLAFRKPTGTNIPLRRIVWTSSMNCRTPRRLNPGIPPYAFLISIGFATGALRFHSSAPWATTQHELCPHC